MSPKAKLDAASPFERQQIRKSRKLQEGEQRSCSGMGASRPRFRYQEKKRMPQSPWTTVGCKLHYNQEAMFGLFLKQHKMGCWQECCVCEENRARWICASLPKTELMRRWRLSRKSSLVSMTCKLQVLPNSEGSKHQASFAAACARLPTAVLQGAQKPVKVDNKFYLDVLRCSADLVSPLGIHYNPQ